MNKDKSFPSYLRAILLIGIIFSLMLVGCSSIDSNPNIPGGQASDIVYRDVTATEAQELLASKTRLQLVDVREEWEFKAGHIPTSMLIPLGSLADNLELIDPDRPVLLICRTGNRSGQAAKLLNSKGYTQVYNLLGGIAAWPEQLMIAD